MADPADPSEAARPDAERSGRSHVIHHGATDMGLLAPTPLALGVVAAALIPSSANATTSASVSANTGGIAGAAPGSAIHSSSDLDDAAGSVRAVGDGAQAGGITGAAPTGPQPQIELAINGHPVAFVPFENGSQVAVQPSPPPNVVGDATAPPGVAAPSADTIDAVDAVRTSAEALTGALEMLVSRLDVPAQQAAAEVATTIDGLTNALEAQTGTLAAAAGDTVDAIGNTVSATVDTAVAQVDALLDQADGLAADLDGHIDRVGDIAAAVVDQAGAAIGSAAGGADQVVATAAASAGAILTDIGTVTAAAAQDVQAGLTGADPVAGLATLSGLLEASDSFEIVRDGDAAPVFASVAAIPDAIDPIVGTVTADLGTDDGGLLDTASDGLSTLLGGDKHGLGGLFDGDHDHG
jgi:hypothetical protein